MYNNAKSCVRVGNNLTACFGCNVGVHQGENLSPILFLLFLNDLSDSLASKFQGLNLLSDTVHSLLDDEDVAVFFKLYVLLYADDTVILAESSEELQFSELNAMSSYCNTWKGHSFLQK